jgi:hypothetical protein
MEEPKMPVITPKKAVQSFKTKEKSFPPVAKLSTDLKP